MKLIFFNTKNVTCKAMNTSGNIPTILKVPLLSGIMSVIYGLDGNAAT
jgi:hypothetical protein